MDEDRCALHGCLGRDQQPVTYAGLLASVAQSRPTKLPPKHLPLHLPRPAALLLSVQLPDEQPAAAASLLLRLLLEPHHVPCCRHQLPCAVPQLQLPAAGKRSTITTCVTCTCPKQSGCCVTWLNQLGHNFSSPCHRCVPVCMGAHNGPSQVRWCLAHAWAYAQQIPASITSLLSCKLT
jgi:hypothetical protein